MELILDSNQLTSAEFSAPSQFGFVIGGYQGGTWVAEMQTPDGDWVILNDSDYNRAGAWVAPGFPGGGVAVHWWDGWREDMGRRRLHQRIRPWSRRKAVQGLCTRRGPTVGLWRIG